MHEVYSLFPIIDIFDVIILFTLHSFLTELQDGDCKYTFYGLTGIYKNKAYPYPYTTAECVAEINSWNNSITISMLKEMHSNDEDSYCYYKTVLVCVVFQVLWYMGKQDIFTRLILCCCKATIGYNINYQTGKLNLDWVFYIN